MLPVVLGHFILTGIGGADCVAPHSERVAVVTHTRWVMHMWPWRPTIDIAVFRVPPANTGNSEGHVDYRLARAAVLADYKGGVLDRADVCDAHPELVRAARQVGTPVAGECPICDRKKLVHVTYVFGPRLPKHGRCITLRGELTRLAKRGGTHVAYAVEVCQSCCWNHLVRRSTLQRPTETAPTSSEEGASAASNVRGDTD